MVLFALAAVLPVSNWTIVCGGDIMLNGLTPSQKRLQAIKPILSRCDVSLANLEVPLTQASVPTPWKSASEVAKHTQYILKADRTHASFLALAGFKVLTEGNNHAMDYGWAGAYEARESLRRSGVLVGGTGLNAVAAAEPVRCTLPDGSKLSILAALAFATRAAAHKCTPATHFGPGVATLFLGGQDLKARISQARAGSGPVILFLHWGVERTPLPRPYQVALGRACIDAGADAVVGSHPHVMQGGEVYRGKPILYSLGNLISAGSGVTDLAELNFQGRKFVGFRLHTFSARHGFVTPMDVPSSKAAHASFVNLSEQIQTHFRSPLSRRLDQD